MKKINNKKNQKLNLKYPIALHISLWLIFLFMLALNFRPTITGYAIMHSYSEVSLPAAGSTTPSGAATGIWPSLNSEFLEGKSLADITGMAAGGGGSGAGCLWMYSGACASGWLEYTSANYKCSSTTFNPPGGICDGSARAAKLCCFQGSQPEICDNYDNDLDGQTDEGCDDDNDNYCDKAITLSGTPSTCTAGGNDCDDTIANINPGKPEVCGQLDENCDGKKVDIDCDQYCPLGETAWQGICIGDPNFGGAFIDCNDNDPGMRVGLPRELGFTVEYNQLDAPNWFPKDSECDNRKYNYYAGRQEQIFTNPIVNVGGTNYPVSIQQVNNANYFCYTQGYGYATSYGTDPDGPSVASATASWNYVTGVTWTVVNTYTYSKIKCVGEYGLLR